MFGRRQHREDRGDADTARHEAEALSRRPVTRHGERKGVAWPAGGHHGADGQFVVDLDRAASTGRDAAHRDAVGIAAGRVTAQRVLADPPAGQVNVDVRTRMPAGQVVTVQCRQRQRDDVLVVGDDPALGDDEGEVAVDLERKGRPAQCARECEHSGHRQVGQTEHPVAPSAAERAWRDVAEASDQPHQR